MMKTCSCGCTHNSDVCPNPACPGKAELSEAEKAWIAYYAVNAVPSPNRHELPSYRATFLAGYSACQDRFSALVGVVVGEVAEKLEGQK